MIPPWSHDRGRLLRRRRPRGVPPASMAWTASSWSCIRAITAPAIRSTPCSRPRLALRERDRHRVLLRRRRQRVPQGHGFRRRSRDSANHALPSVPAARTSCPPRSPRPTFTSSSWASRSSASCIRARSTTSARLGIPFLYIGPSPSHVTELAPTASFAHGDIAGVARFIGGSVAAAPVVPVPAATAIFSQEVLLQRMLRTIESVALAHPAGAPAETITAE